MLNYSRRDFLTHGFAASAALGVWARFAHGQDAAAPGARMRFGLVTYQWGRDWDLPTLLANCEKSQVLGVELRTTHAHGVEPTLNKAAREEVKKRFAGSPVELVGIGSNERYDHPKPMDLAKAIQATKDFLELSHDVGGSGVKVKPNDFHEDIPREKTIEQIGKALHVLGQFGADLGQEVRLEVHGQCSELPTIKAIMDATDHANVGVCWNSNDVDLEGEGLEHNFNLVKKYFGDTAHVRELNIGDYPYQQLMSLFVGMDYDGWILLEARTEPGDRVKALVEQREVFQEMVARAQAAGQEQG